MRRNVVAFSQMDKFAVDLDQVLNDFEYSELTDHFNTATNNYHKNTAQIQPNNGESSSIHSQFTNSNNAVTKHSITNVFNSLSEYLNSDITPKYSNSIPAERDEEITVNDRIVKRLNCELEIDNNIANVQLESDKNEGQVGDVVVEEIVEIDMENGEEDMITKLVDVVDEIDAKLEQIKEDIHKNETIETEMKEEECVSVIEKVISTEEVEIAQPEETNEPETEMEEKLVAQTPPETVVDEKLPETQCVGFVDDLNLDDSEINNAFAELEAEFDVEREEVEKMEDAEVVESEKEVVSDEKEELDVEIAENIVEEPVLERPQNLAVTNEPSTEPKREINLIGTCNVFCHSFVLMCIFQGDPGSTPYNNVYIAKEIGPSARKVENADNSDTDDSTASYSDESLDSGCSASTASTEAVTDDVNDKDKVPESVNKEVSNADVAANNENVIENENLVNSEEEPRLEGNLEEEMETSEGATALVEGSERIEASEMSVHALTTSQGEVYSYLKRKVSRSG